MNCPFCTKTDADFYIETENFAAIYNIAPILPGHTLVIPKKHYQSLFELSDQELSEFMILGRKVARLLAHIFLTDAFDWAIQEKEAAGQSVAHLHMHIVPRKIGDLPHPGDWYTALEKSEQTGIDTEIRRKLNQEEMVSITHRLKEEAGKFFNTHSNSL